MVTSTSVRSFSAVSEIIGVLLLFFFFQAEDGIRDIGVTGVQTCALPISERHPALEREGVDALRAVGRRRVDDEEDGLEAVEALRLGERGRLHHVPAVGVRSEERRVGKECRSRWSPYH